MINEINFVETDAKKVNKELMDGFQKLIGEILYPGDERRIFLQQLTPFAVALRHLINDSARQNLLRYSRGEKLDGLGEDMYQTTRLKSQKAHCRCAFKLSKIRESDIIIPKGTRVSPDGNIIFYTTKDITILKGNIEGFGEIEAENPGVDYNGFIEGQINLMIDLIPFVEKVYNTEISRGGTRDEDDERYRERCRLSQEKLSTTGPNNAYIYFAKEAHVSVKDAKAVSPTPGVVKIVILTDDKENEEDIVEAVLKNCSARDKRPLTDYVEAVLCGEHEYDIELTYYLDKNHAADESNFRRNIEGQNLDNADGAIREYINWQSDFLGKSINPDELRFKIQNAATYQTIDNKEFTTVRRIDLVSPVHTKIDADKVAKVRNIIINYGGLE